MSDRRRSSNFADDFPSIELNDDDDDDDDDKLFCDMVDQRKLFSLISSWHHCQRYSLSRISNMLRAGF